MNESTLPLVKCRLERATSNANGFERQFPIPGHGQPDFVVELEQGRFDRGFLGSEALPELAPLRAGEGTSNACVQSVRLIGNVG